MKKCKVCKNSKGINMYSLHAGFTDGRHSTCKTCIRSIRKSKEIPFINKMYSTQQAASKRRNHPPPAYTKDAFTQWVLSQPNWKKLWQDYQDFNHKKNLAPSADRVNPNLPYSLTNIELVTWDENDKRGSIALKAGITTSQHKAVTAFNPDGSIYGQYVSLHEAHRATGAAVTNIQRVADKTVITKPNGRTTTLRKTKGLLWAWTIP